MPHSAKRATNVGLKNLTYFCSGRFLLYRSSVQVAERGCLFIADDLTIVDITSFR